MASEINGTALAVRDETTRDIASIDLTAIRMRIVARIDIDLSSGCWEWRGAKTSAGYGLIKVTGLRSPQYVHRLMYEASVGAIGNGLDIDHLCRNRACANPKHLEPVTRGENTARGASPRARISAGDRCGKGHLKAEAGQYVRPNGWSECRQCRRERAARQQGDNRE